MRQQAFKTRHPNLMRRLFGVSLTLLCGACQGYISAPGAGAGAGASDGQNGGGGSPGQVCVGDLCTGGNSGTNPGEPATPGIAAMRRLNNAEYANTVRDLFGSAGTTVTFPVEGRTDGFDTLSTALAVSQVHIEAYLDAAAELVTELFDQDPAGLRAAFCDYQSGDAAADLGCAQRIVSDFAARAWRRPLETWPDGQADADYLALLDPAGTLAASSLDTRLRTALEAVLVSPRFIFRVEFADAGGTLDTPSLASRLSYFLWSSAPDTELLSSDLQQNTVLEAQVSRLQESERFQRFLERFPQLWLELEKLDTVERDPDVYPGYSPELVAEMGAETRRFFASYWANPNASVNGILLAPNPAVSDPDLAALYGDSPRLGLVTQASIMTLTGASNRTSPVRRGKWVLERLLCDEPPPPPDGLIAELTEDLVSDPTLTERERLARHRVEPTCAGCHVTMDAIGLGFENYDSIGAYRSLEPNGEQIDATGVLPPDDAPFGGPLELIQLLARDERLRSCVAKQLLTYGTGRTYSWKDDVLVDLITLYAGGDAATFRSMLNGVVLSDAFRRRDEEG
jgi:hypothetical protein